MKIMNQLTPQVVLNMKHCLEPQLGDIWSERVFLPYHAVLDLTDRDTIIICDKFQRGSGVGLIADLSSVREVTKEEHLKLTLYSTDRNAYNLTDNRPIRFLLDVDPGKADVITGLIPVIERWKSGGSQYKTLEEQNNSKQVAVEEELKRNAGFILFREELKQLCIKHNLSFKPSHGVLLFQDYTDGDMVYLDKLNGYIKQEK